MRAENFIAFFTVCGFFVGLIFTILSSNDAIEMMIHTILVTFFFYLIIHIIIMNYVDVRRAMKQFFDKQKHEDVAEYLMGELAIREKRMENLVVNVAINKAGAEKNARKAKAA
ncbi:hypothetical protein [Campylobacter mucosalis]|uniref:hypothetical protein n=1 Tax=Campylobacter mucosalis TaxID=202 RepID=UPI00146FF509|nr:hypothetical protein [Campylobacter mucosalis]